MPTNPDMTASNKLDALRNFLGQEGKGRPLSLRFPVGSVIRHVETLERTLSDVRKAIERIVCTEGEDAGVVLLSQDGVTHREVIDGKTVHVYDLKYFSPLGEVLMGMYRLVENFNDDD